MHGESCLNDLLGENVQSVKRTESYYAIKITALNGFEQGTYYFFSYRFYSAVHWKRRDREKKMQSRRDEDVEEKST